MNNRVVRFDNRFALGRLIDVDLVGDIMIHIGADNARPITLKLEAVANETSTLAKEAEVYSILNGIVGIPSLCWFGHGCDRNVIVLDLLRGPTLKDLFELCNGRFSLKTVLLLAKQLITRLEHIHDRGFINRLITPANFAICICEGGSLVYLMGFGFAKKYVDLDTGVHIPIGQTKGLTGTARYASINSHHGVEQSRRDDMESLGYMLLHFIRGSTPWQNLEAFEKIKEVKETVPSEALCEGLPNEFRVYIDYVRSLPFDKRPDYDYLRQIFNNVMVRRGYMDDGLFDWHTLKFVEKLKRNLSNWASRHQ